MAWTALESRDLKRGVALFITFGLLMAVVWARLRAPDLALAEAAIGAGLSGALLLAALRDEPVLHVAKPDLSPWLIWLINGFILVLAILFAWALLHAMTTADPNRLALAASEQLDRSGVGNPVTAVLLNFRAYDTVLELAVVLVAVLGVLALAPARPGFAAAGPILASLGHWLLPLLILAAAYLLWAGAHAPGGAFQAGATLAAAGVLLRIVGNTRGGLPAAVHVRWLVAIGVGSFVAIGLLVMPGGYAFLQYPDGWAGVLILLIESAATVSIAVGLILAYIGGRPDDWRVSVGRAGERG